VNDERISVVEMEELMFSPALYPIDPLSLDGARSSGREFSLEGGMDGFDRCDRFPQRRAAQGARGALNFR
jgi:hypothetical protein